MNNCEVYEQKDIVAAAELLRQTLAEEQSKSEQMQASDFINNLSLRDINIIIFLDWSQPEYQLYQDLASVITSMVTHPNKNQTTLLINIENISEDQAILVLSNVVMNLFLEKDLDVADGPEISLMGQLDEKQWEVLLPRIHARIILENENQGAIATVKTKILPTYELNSFDLK